MSSTHPGSVKASVTVSVEEVALILHDQRPESLALFGDLPETAREQLVLDAWSIGLRALRNAYISAQESQLKDIGANLISDIDRQLRAHVEKQQATIDRVLKEFFDPRDGQVSQRLAAFVGDEGVLARQLNRYLGPQNSVLAESLARQVGETSPIFKKLSPTDSGGLVKMLETQLGHVMEQNHDALVRALDPLEEDGAVARFLRRLREELKSADEDRQRQLGAALSALDANNESSLLSRLVRETNQAQQVVLAAVNPDAPASPMALLKSSLTKLLQDQASVQQEVAKRQEERQAHFENDVREALTRIELKRTQDQKTIRGGLNFEDAVTSFVRATTRGTPCVFQATGATAGIGRCKKGDAVLRFTDESAFAGAGVVFEAKHDSTYTPQRAVSELDAARKNRDAVAGVFVMARSHASEEFPQFARYGNNVLVVWDEQDSSTDPYLEAAILLGMGLVSRSRPVGDPGDVAAMRDVESRIEAEVKRLERLVKHTDGIRRNVAGIESEVSDARGELNALLRKAQSTLRALNVEMRDESEERESPLTFSSSASVLARFAGGAA